MIEIIHVSDLHFGKKTVKAKRLLGKIKDEYKIGEIPNRYLLATGDITDSGTKGQYDLAVKALSVFKDNVYVVPGNHDYEGWGIWYDPKSAKRFDRTLCKRLGVNHDFFPRIPFSNVLDDKAGNQVLIIGLNSCSTVPLLLDLSEGEIGEDQRNELKKTLDRQNYSKTPKIVFLHHVPHKRSVGIGMRLRDYRELMSLVRNKVDALLFGHTGAMEDVSKSEMKKLGISESKRIKLETAQKNAMVGRELKIRSGRAQGIRYYLDANKSVEDQACYNIKIDENSVSASRKIF